MGKYRYWVEEDVKGGITAFTTALEHEPRAGIYQFRSFAYEDLELYAEALSDLDSAIDLEPNPVFHQSKAEIHLRLGDPDAAIVDYQRAIELASTDQDQYMLCSLHEERADMCMDKGCYEQAVSDYTKLIECRPEDPYLAYHSRGDAYQELGQYEAAIADYTAAIELRPDWDLNYWKRALAYKELGQIAKAIADFQKLIDMDSSWASSAERELEELETEKQ